MIPIAALLAPSITRVADSCSRLMALPCPGAQQLRHVEVMVHPSGLPSPKYRVLRLLLRTHRASVGADTCISRCIDASRCILLCATATCWSCLLAEELRHALRLLAATTTTTTSSSRQRHRDIEPIAVADVEYGRHPTAAHLSTLRLLRCADRLKLIRKHLAYVHAQPATVEG